VQERHSAISEPDVVVDRQMRREAQLLRDHREAKALRGLGRRDLMCLAVDPNRSAIGTMDAHEHFHQRAFARAILAAQRSDLASGDGKVDVMQRHHGTETFRDPFSAQDRRASIHGKCHEIAA
jgi:hypothetical protein